MKKPPGRIRKGNDRHSPGAVRIARGECSAAPSGTICFTFSHFDSRVVGLLRIAAKQESRKGPKQAGQTLRAVTMDSFGAIRLRSGSNPLLTIKKYADWQKWGHDWLDEESLIVTVEGQWRTFTVVLTWAGEDESLRLFCSFPIALEANRELDIYRTLNLLNQSSGFGGLTLDFDAGIVTYRKRLEVPVNARGAAALPCVMLHEVTEFCDLCYPALEMVNIGHSRPEDAAGIALMEVVGRA